VFFLAWARLNGANGGMDERPQANRKFKTCRRYNDVGHAHMLTFTCFQRLRLLSKRRSCQWLGDAIIKAQEKHRFHVWCYVFMPEHVHLVIWPSQATYSISSILATIKQSVSRRAYHFLRQHSPDFLSRLCDEQPSGKVDYRFWQRGGGHDRNITSPHVLQSEINYIHANPVRRGLCERPEQWPWSSAGRHLGYKKGPVPIDFASLRDFLDSQ
jgi:putative transposase